MLSKARRPRRSDLIRLLRVALVAVGLLPWALLLLPISVPELRLAFHGLCHQLPERTWQLGGEPMVVCSRCAGLYAGLAAGALLPLPRRWLAWGRALILVVVGLNLIELGTEALGLRLLSHPPRMVVGALLGWALAALAVTALRRELDPEIRDQQPSAPA